MLVSVVGPHTAALAFRAAMNVSSPASITLMDVGFWAGRCKKLNGSGKYLTRTHRLGYDQVQVTAWAKPESGFMPCISQEAVWQLINKPPFTTPLKREWMDGWLYDHMVNHRMIRENKNFNCDSGMFLLSPERLDSMVSEGLKMGIIRI